MDFIQAKQKKERGYSVGEVVNDLIEKQSEYRGLIVIGVSDDNGIDIAYSNDSDAELIGLCEVAKSTLTDAIREIE